MVFGSGLFPGPFLPCSYFYVSPNVCFCKYAKKKNMPSKCVLIISVRLSENNFGEQTWWKNRTDETPAWISHMPGTRQTFHEPTRDNWASQNPTVRTESGRGPQRRPRCIGSIQHILLLYTLPMLWFTTCQLANTSSHFLSLLVRQQQEESHYPYFALWRKQSQKVQILSHNNTAH